MVLADWGAAGLAERRPTDALRAHWFAIPLLRLIAELAAPGAGVVEVRLDEGTFHIRLNEGEPGYCHGPAEQPDAQLTIDAHACLALTQGSASLREMIKKGEVGIDGDSPLADALRSHRPTPDRPDPDRPDPGWPTQDSCRQAHAGLASTPGRPNAGNTVCLDGREAGSVQAGGP